MVSSANTFRHNDIAFISTCARLSAVKEREFLPAVIHRLRFAGKHTDALFMLDHPNSGKGTIV